MEKPQRRDCLIDRRMLLKMSQEQAAEALKISQTYYSAIERGERSPGFELAIRISDYFNIDIRKLKT